MRAEIAKGKREVKIFTARVAEGQRAVPYINEWCREHLGMALAVTNEKDFACDEIWDDRARQVVKNTGKFVDEA